VPRPTPTPAPEIRQVETLRALQIKFTYLLTYLIDQLFCGVEMESDPRRLGGLLYDLTFINVTKDDAQVIQCNISNKHGWNYTNAYINVYSEYHPLFSCVVFSTALCGWILVLFCRVICYSRASVHRRMFSDWRESG